VGFDGKKGLKKKLLKTAKLGHERKIRLPGGWTHKAVKGRGRNLFDIKRE